MMESLLHTLRRSMVNNFVVSLLLRLNFRASSLNFRGRGPLRGFSTKWNTIYVLEIVIIIYFFYASSIIDTIDSRADSLSPHPPLRLSGRHRAQTYELVVARDSGCVEPCRPVRAQQLENVSVAIELVQNRLRISLKSI